MATPPTSGVEAVRQRLAAGVRSSPCDSREWSSAQTARRVVGKAARAATVLTGSEGRASVLGLCVPGRRRPTLLRADDGLRRPAALPRALCEPLPPRLPGEVQGLAARRRLVAPEPARPARRLSRRLRRPLPEQDDPALPDLPARGPRLLALLLRVPPGGGALDDRQRRADQEGSLPAAARRALDGGDTSSDVRGDARDSRRALA